MTHPNIDFCPWWEIALWRLRNLAGKLLFWLVGCEPLLICRICRRSFVKSKLISHLDYFHHGWRDIYRSSLKQY